MKNKIFAVLDLKAESYGTPIFLATEGLAIRAFRDQVNTVDSPLSKHPEDYVLYQIGEYNSANGDITPINRKSLGTGTDYFDNKEV